MFATAQSTKNTQPQKLTSLPGDSTLDEYEKKIHNFAVPPQAKYQIYIKPCYRLGEDTCEMQVVDTTIPAKISKPTSTDHMSTKLNKFVNRYNHMSLELLLLNTTDKYHMGAILLDEAAATDPPSDSLSAILGALYNDTLRYFIKNYAYVEPCVKSTGAPTVIPKAHNQVHSTMQWITQVRGKWNSLTDLQRAYLGMRYTNPPHPPEVTGLIGADVLAASYMNSLLRYRHHECKSAKRVQTHFENLAGHVSRATDTKNLTEARGEFAATKVMLTLYGSEDPQQANYQLKWYFVGHGHTGVDQIWAKRSPNGVITQYVIVEAKGSCNASLGTASYGEQMSPRWVYHHILNIYKNGQTRSLGQKILSAMLGVTGFEGVKVWGLIVQSLFDKERPTDTNSNVIEFQDCGQYKIDPATLKDDPFKD